MPEYAERGPAPRPPDRRNQNTNGKSLDQNSIDQSVEGATQKIESKVSPQQSTGVNQSEGRKIDHQQQEYLFGAFEIPDFDSTKTFPKIKRSTNPSNDENIDDSPATTEILANEVRGGEGAYSKYLEIPGKGTLYVANNFVKFERFSKPIGYEGGPLLIDPELWFLRDVKFVTEDERTIYFRLEGKTKVKNSFGREVNLNIKGLSTLDWKMLVEGNDLNEGSANGIHFGFSESSLAVLLDEAKGANPNSETLFEPVLDEAF